MLLSSADKISQQIETSRSVSRIFSLFSRDRENNGCWSIIRWALRCKNSFYNEARVKVCAVGVCFACWRKGVGSRRERARSWRQRRSGSAIDEAKLSHRPSSLLSGAAAENHWRRTACGCCEREQCGVCAAWKIQQVIFIAQPAGWAAITCYGGWGESRHVVNAARDIKRDDEGSIWTAS